MLRMMGVFAIVVFTLAIGVVVGYAIPDTNGVIRGCFKVTGNPNTRGALRIIDTDAGDMCASDEGAISWQQGNASTYSKNQTFTFPVGPRSRVLQCDPGDVTTGGGFRSGSGPLGVHVEESHQTLALDGWVLTLQNNAGSEATAEIFVICKNLTL